MPFDSTRSDVIAQIEALLSLPHSKAVAIPAVAAATDYEVPVYVAGASALSSVVSRLSVFLAAAITGAGTNTATLTFRLWRAGALVGTVTGSSTYVTTVSLAAQTEKNLFKGSLTLKPGDVITLAATHAASGAALPLLTAVVEASPNAK